MKQIYNTIMRFTTYFSRLTLILFTLVGFSSPVCAVWSDGSGEGVKENGVWYVLYDTTEYSIGLLKTKTFDLAGPGDILTFEAKRTYLGAGNLRVSQNEGSPTNLYEGNPGKLQGWTSVEYDSYGPYSLNVNTSVLTFYAPLGVTGDKKFRNIKVTMASYCKYETSGELNFGSGVYLEQEQSTRKILWSNIADKDITITGVNSERFSVSVKSVGSTVGKWGNTIVTITYKRDVVGSHTANLNVNGNSIVLKGTTTTVTPSIIECASASEIPYQSVIGSSTLTPGTAKHPTKDLAVDGTWTWQNSTLTADAYRTYAVVFTPDSKYNGGYTAQTCSIAIPITKLNQTITWNLADGEGVEYTTGVEMGATASSGLDVEYTSSNPSAATIVNGKLNVIIPGVVVTITATQGGNDNYNAAEPVSKTFTTVGATPDDWSTVTASDITYEQPLEASVLSGEVKVNGVAIPGTLTWLEPTMLPNAGNGQLFPARFTPENTAVYASVTFDVAVNVAKATPAITWNISRALRENVRYANFITSSNKETDLILSSSNSTLLQVDGAMLTTGEVSDKVNDLTIYVNQAATANYNAVSTGLSVTLYPKAGICLPFNPMTENDFQEAGMIDDAAVWCDTNEDGKAEWAGFYDVIYTRKEGIALGSWQGGFDYNTKAVKLFFSGVPKDIRFTAYLQTVTTSDHVHWPATNGKVKVLESADGSTFTTVGSEFTASSRGANFSGTLKATTRYIQIEYAGNFACFINNLVITSNAYIRADRSELVFGTETHPLQEPQAITLSYSSIGECLGTNDAITITSSNPAFYVDETTITENVGVELSGSHTIRVRCSDVNQSGVIRFEANDGTVLEVPVRSTKPYITTAATSIFETGTEHAVEAGSAYRTRRTHDFSACFDGAKAKYDTLYIYGVTESSAAARLWDYDAGKKYNVPAVDIVAGNVSTPCFVYTKNNSQYDYVRTFDAATTTLNIGAAQKKLGFVGYKPASEATTIPALQITGVPTHIYFDNVEIIASGAVLAINGWETIYARGTNTLTSKRATAVEMADEAKLTIEDSWTNDAVSAILALRPAAGQPSIDLGGAKSIVTINGTQLELHNATNMAIAHMDGATELSDGAVKINDGSVGGEVILGMPHNTLIDGGTFNDGTVKCFTAKRHWVRPMNSRGDLLARATMVKSLLPEWYGQSHLTLDATSKVNPMLLDPTICIFYGTEDEDAYNDKNWTLFPEENSDAIIKAHMIVEGEFTLNSMIITPGDTVSVTIAPSGGLTIGEGGIIGATKENLKLQAGTEDEVKGKTGYLRIMPDAEGTMPEATVELFSIGYYDMSSDEENIAAWQYVGTPVETETLAKTFFKSSWIYSWDESKGDWVNNRYSLVMNPFEGYATTQYKFDVGALITFAGNLLEGKEYEVALTANGITDEQGCNVIANSFAAPIDITKFEDSDFSEGVDPIVYLYNTGSRKDAEKMTKSASTDAPGQYIAIPVGSVKALKAAYDLPTVIAPMQGFCVKANKAGSVKLNYDRLVWGGDYKSNPNTPLRAPKRDVELNDLGSLCVTLSANGWKDNLYLLEAAAYDKAFEAGYDAPKMNSGEFNVFAVEDEKNLAVDATNCMIGTHIGVRTGAETAYTLIFSHLSSNNELQLYDSETSEITDMYEGLEYTFYAEPNSVLTDRFQIVGTVKVPEVTTDIDKAETQGAKVRKFIKDNQLYILKDGVLYNAVGAVVR